MMRNQMVITMFSQNRWLVSSSICSLLMVTSLGSNFATHAEETKIPVTFSGGHELNKNDYGRPINLMAAALGVKPDEFRKAFSGVTPARGRGADR